MDIKVNITDGASDSLMALIMGLTGPEAAGINAVAGRAAAEEATRYHRDFGAAGGWENPALPTHGPGRESTGFANQVANSWSFRTSSETGAIIGNDAPHLRHKIQGGTITAKRVNFLTIPVVPEAHGRRAAEYERDFGRDLFTIKGRNALFERTTETGSESVRDRTYGKKKNGQRLQISARGHIRAVYALTRSVTQGAVVGAMPPTKQLADAYSDAWIDELLKKLD